MVVIRYLYLLLQMLVIREKIMSPWARVRYTTLKNDRLLVPLPTNEPTSLSVVVIFNSEWVNLAILWKKNSSKHIFIIIERLCTLFSHRTTPLSMPELPGTTNQLRVARFICWQRHNFRLISYLYCKQTSHAKFTSLDSVRTLPSHIVLQASLTPLQYC